MKRFPLGVLLFALVWALTFWLPPVREMARALPLLMNTNGAYLDATRSGRLPPGDPITIEWNLSNDIEVSRRQRIESLRQLDALAARFPAQVWISAARLRRTVNPAPRFDTGTGTPRAKASDWLDPRDLNRAALVAARAGGREPDNSFWPWMEADFRFALGQNAAGVACMERAGNAARFDDYVRSTAHARLALWLQHDNPAWEQRVALNFGMLFPHMGAMHDVSRATAVQALTARNRGDNARALRIGTALLHANQVGRRDSESVIGSLVAETSGRESLEKLLGVPLLKGSASPDERAGHARELQQRWAHFARDNGRGDLASRANWLAEPSISQQLNQFWSQDIWGEFGLPASQGRFVVLAPLLLFSLAALCFALALVWLIGALLSLRLIGGALPPRGQVAACANFGFWALAGTLAVGIQTGWLFGLLQPYSGLSAQNSSPIAPLFCGVFAASCWLLPVAFLSWKRDRRLQLVRPRRQARALSRRFAGARVAVWLLFLLFAVLVASNGRGMWDDTPFQLPVSVPVASASLICALVLEAIRFGRRGRALPRLQLQGEPPDANAPRFLRVARFGAWLVASLCLFCLAGLAIGLFDLPPASEIIALPVGVAATALALALSRKIGRGDGFVWRLATRSAGVLSLAWSFGFLVLVLAIWPLRAELNHQLDRRLSMREADWMREQLRKLPPDSLPP